MAVTEFISPTPSVEILIPCQYLASPNIDILTRFITFKILF